MLKPSLQVLVLCLVASGMCSASEDAARVPDNDTNCGDDESSIGCADPGCGEDFDGGACEYTLLDCGALFGSVLGDEPLLKGLKTRKLAD